jgi:hypothetical protein
MHDNKDSAMKYSTPLTLGLNYLATVSQEEPESIRPSCCRTPQWGSATTPKVMFNIKYGTDMT